MAKKYKTIGEFIHWTRREKKLTIPQLAEEVSQVGYGALGALFDNPVEALEDLEANRRLPDDMELHDLSKVLDFDKHYANQIIWKQGAKKRRRERSKLALLGGCLIAIVAPVLILLNLLLSQFPFIKIPEGYFPALFALGIGYVAFIWIYHQNYNRDKDFRQISEELDLFLDFLGEHFPVEINKLREELRVIKRKYESQKI